MFKKYWWKVIAVLLVAYSIIVGIGTPMGAGIQTITPTWVEKAGLQTFTITSYNADYAKEITDGNFNVRLRISPTQSICPIAVRTGNGDTLYLDFNFPDAKLPIDYTPLGKNKRAIYPLLEVSTKNYGYTSIQSAIGFAEYSENSIEASAFCDVNFADAKPFRFPYINILEETIRNLFYHVPMWFGMMFLLTVSMVYSVKHLRNPQNVKFDNAARSFAIVGVLFGILGVVTGAWWARFTWGAFWSWDVKQNTSAVALLIYLAYFVLRDSFDDFDKRARVGAIYNIFAYAALIPLLYIVPRMVDSLHPGTDGNPAFSSYDLDNTLRNVFYPSVIAWIMTGVWLAQLTIKKNFLKAKYETKHNN